MTSPRLKPSFGADLGYASETFLEVPFLACAAMLLLPCQHLQVDTQNQTDHQPWSFVRGCVLFLNSSKPQRQSLNEGSSAQLRLLTQCVSGNTYQYDNFARCTEARVELVCQSSFETFSWHREASSSRWSPCPRCDAWTRILGSTYSREELTSDQALSKAGLCMLTTACKSCRLGFQPLRFIAL